MKNIIEQRVEKILDDMDLEAEIKHEIEVFKQSEEFKNIIRDKVSIYIADYASDYVGDILEGEDLFNPIKEFISKKITLAFKK